MRETKHRRKRSGVEQARPQLRAPKVALSVPKALHRRLARPRRRAAVDAPQVLPLYQGFGRPSRLKRGFFMLLALGFCFLWGAAFSLLAPIFVAPLMFPLLAMALLVIWALPETDAAPTGALRVLLFVFLISMVMWPYYLAIAIPGIPRLTIQRITGAPILLLLLISLSTSANFRRVLKEAFSATPTLFWLIMAFYIIQVVSVGFSANKGASLNDLLVDTINWTALYVVTTYVCSREGTSVRLASVLCAMAAALVGLSFLEHKVGHVLWAGHVPPIFVVDDPVVQRILAGAARPGTGHRVQATFGTSLGLSEYFALTAPFLMHFGFTRRTLLLRAGALLLLPLVIAACFLTQARTGLIGIFLALLFYPVILFVLYWIRRPQSFLASSLVYGSPVLLIGGGVSAFAVKGIRYRLLGGGADQYSNQGRIDQMHMGIPKILSHPWGHGIGQGAETLGYTNLAGMLTIDSYVLRVALEYGILGLAIFYGIFIAALLRGTRGLLTLSEEEQNGEAGLLAAICIALGAYLVMRTAFAQEDNQPIVYIFFGMLTAISARLGSRPISLFTRAAKGAGRN